MYARVSVLGTVAELAQKVLHGRISAHFEIVVGRYFLISSRKELRIHTEFNAV